MDIQVILDKWAKMPTKAHDTDAGFDLFTPFEFELEHGDSIIIDTGVHVLIPRGYVGMLKSKSGLNCNFGIINEGVVDAGYTGSIKVKLYNIGRFEHCRHFEAGDKISQLVIMPIPDVDLVEVKDFGIETERGNNGFGSTGR